MDWQPIETAPKDGTEIILFIPGYCGEIVIGYGDEDMAFTVDGNEFIDDDEDHFPTHWMTLPQPPGEATYA